MSQHVEFKGTKQLVPKITFGVEARVKISTFWALVGLCCPISSDLSEKKDQIRANFVFFFASDIDMWAECLSSRCGPKLMA